MKTGLHRIELTRLAELGGPFPGMAETAVVALQAWISISRAGARSSWPS